MDFGKWFQKQGKSETLKGLHQHQKADEGPTSSGQSTTDKWNFEQTGLTTAQLEAKNRLAWTEARVRGLWEAHEAEEARIQSGAIDVSDTTLVHALGSPAVLTVDYANSPDKTVCYCVNGAIVAPYPSGGDDTPAIQAVINAAWKWDGLPPDFDSRIGTFEIDHDALRPKEIMAIMAECVILSAVQNISKPRRIRYYAKSRYFAPRVEEAVSREYTFKLSRDPDGTIRALEAY